VAPFPLEKLSKVMTFLLNSPWTILLLAGCGLSSLAMAAYFWLRGLKPSLAGKSSRRLTLLGTFVGVGLLTGAATIHWKRPYLLEQVLPASTVKAFLFNSVWTILLMAACGVFLIATALCFYLRGTNKSVVAKSYRRLTVLCVLAGIGLVSGAATVSWKKPYLLEQFLRSEYADQTRLEKMRMASLGEQVGVTEADDWPQWRGPRRDGVIRSASLRTNWQEKTPDILWRTPIGDGYSSFAVSGGLLYTMDRHGDDERVVCLNTTSGKVVWSYSYAAPYHFKRGFATGPRATPTVCDGCVYTVGATGRFHCFEARPSTEHVEPLWHHDFAADFNVELPDWGYACSPLCQGDLVIVQPGAKDGSVAAFDRKTGRLVWKALSDPASYSSPVAATCAGIEQIVCMTGKGAVGLRAGDGAQLWYYRWAPEDQINAATPIIAGDYVFISSAYRMGCALLELSADGAGGVQAKPVYVKPNKVMRCQTSTCVLFNGFLYGFDVGPGLLKCIDIRTGQEKWSTRALSKGSLILANGHLVVLCEDGLLALVEATPDEFRVKNKLKLFHNSQAWALPALASGRLYLRDDKELICLNVNE
jgi:outer membrane protein assembly factor BamB